MPPDGNQMFINCSSLKGQCIGIEAVQLCIISLPVKSSVIVTLQEFMGFIINNDRRIVQNKWSS